MWRGGPSYRVQTAVCSTVAYYIGAHFIVTSVSLILFSFFSLIFRMRFAIALFVAALCATGLAGDGPPPLPSARFQRCRVEVPPNERFSEFSVSIPFYWKKAARCYTEVTPYLNNTF